ncbi:phosphoserine phosphatase [Chitinivorax tropicus]|uniref:Phosphoserine phosphatase n=1 Tax=Chitinivorax tropicus TaxID=714531 RepID=A0A840MTV1_9PROT|nr:phosphoserine phosphatase SerB [Chitinivorax tropicus]MBB5019796.1 phosphoserine phosphatase [Chitinivorax tropicus]
MYKLVVQAPDIATPDLKHLAHLTQAHAIEAIALPDARHQAFRLLQADPASKADVAAFCEEAGYDFAFIPLGRKLTDFGLVVMDMDSTLITIECIDEIADMQGIKDQVAAITERSMRGELDFSQSLRERVALLAGLDESALERVYSERLQLTPGAERMLQKAHAAGLKSMLVSGGFTFFTARLQARLGLTYAHANTLEVESGKLTGRLIGDILDAQAKADWLMRVRTELGLQTDQVVAMGDGANDLKMLAQAGLGIAFHAKPIVRQQAQYALTHVGLDGWINWFA